MNSKNHLTRYSLLLLIAFIFSVNPGISEEKELTRAEYIRANYTKYEYRIPMRDGIKLFTAVYLPNDIRQKYPILLLRTPYRVAPYGAEKYKKALGPTAKYEHDKFIFVFQDVRGKFMSEGEFVNMTPHVENKKSNSDIDESSDTYDTIEWLLQNIPTHNGKVGQWGISYPGFYASAGMIESHPALKAVSPQAPIADWFWDDMFHNGAFTLNMAFRFFSTFGVTRDSLTKKWPPGIDYKTVDGYQFYLDLGPLENANEKYFHGEIDFWNDITNHPNYDAFWQSRNILPHLKNVSPAVMTVGGLFDAEDLYGAWHTYAAVEKQNPDIENSLVMGPWPHGGWARAEGRILGDQDFGFATSKYYQDRVELNFFRYHLKNGPDPDLPEALIFETGANRWREFEAWPPKGLMQQKFFLSGDRHISRNKPGEERDIYDAYISDPASPVPYTKTITTRWAKTYMTEDQRFASRRPDVLSYTSDILTEEVTFAGPVDVNLWISTSAGDADWVVKIIDVWPGEIKGKDGKLSSKGGQHALIRGDIFRGRFRESFSDPKPFVPDSIESVKFTLQDLLHTFKPGHRIMVQIQSSWFPLFDRNPQRYVPNIFKAKEADFIKAIHRVYRSERHPSFIEVGILK